MKPTSDPLWNRNYVEQRLRDKRYEAELKRIAGEQSHARETNESYWYGEYLDAQNRCTELETENEKLKIMVKALLAAMPSSRVTTITEVW